VALIDIDDAALERARSRLARHTDKAVRRGKLDPERAAAALSRLHTGKDYGALAHCDWAIEAATEDLTLKRRIFAQVEDLVGADALISSNTSSLPAARLFQDLEHPERATVTHFFAPAFRNPIVEVIDWPVLDGTVLLRLRALLAKLGKVPLVCRDVLCFMLDRIFDNWCNEAGLLLSQATASQIDSVAQSLATAGPFFVLNLAGGNPIILKTNAQQASEEGAHYEPAPIFASVERWITVPPGKAQPVSEELASQVKDRLLGILLSQAVDILDRDIGHPADLELGSRIAFGLRAGPLECMVRMGPQQVQRVFARLHRERPGLPGLRRDLAAYTTFERHVLVDDLNDIKVVTLRRPDALNALHDELNDELLAVLQRYEHEPRVSGFIITGYGNKAFCAGADIGRFHDLLGDAAAAAEYAHACSRVLVYLDSLRKPVVAALNGIAFGGGLELALRCHAIVAVPDAMLQFPEVTLGIVPGIGGLVVPFRRWPQASAIFVSMLTRAERVSAAQAQSLGIIDECVPSFEQFWSGAVAQVQRLKAQGLPSASAARVAAVTQSGPAPAVSTEGLVLSQEILVLLRRAIRDAAAASTLTEALEVGYRAFGASACTAAAREGIAAFRERRKPDFARTG